MKSYQKKTIAQLSIAMLLSMMVNLVAAEPPYLGMGAKTGEVSANTAVINIRLSESIGQQRNHGIPGKLGKARIQYSLSEQLIPSFLSEWRSSDSENDYYLQYQLTDLKSNSRYYYRAELVDSVTNK
jgi:phosphodiesterase/alkaline phosphatase D-like protein